MKIPVVPEKAVPKSAVVVENKSSPRAPHPQTLYLPHMLPQAFIAAQMRQEPATNGGLYMRLYMGFKGLDGSLRCKACGQEV